ncbi:N-terminal double-transmembrane domain-containing protein [Litoreibacter ascidiaceicola]|uniref:N-terminal double-transmembrane domain-containing protein n=1 Tax=Litoreibacter ascidiaceicola TaxID=1486859 RepID=A0A1M5CKY6_9RHOB|nr:DUF4159 domain-containing protein [Litoreibacter ascidiaceicola]SHF55370.1 N-terminal double-transmembrane domain-containing protein [Litoreibacter ascidiaceicola]
MIANLAFTTPLLLAALAILPILWWLLRAVPPAPIKRRFPGIALLLGLNDDETQTDTTPWWLLLLRMLAVAAFIIGFAGPVLNPEEDRAGSGPLLIAMDGSWASARDWPARIARVEELLAEAAREGRPAAIAVLSDPPAGDLAFQSADTVAATLAGVQPRAWEPNADKLADWQTRLGDTAFETVWFSDGLDRESRSELLETLNDKGAVTVIETPRPVYALTPAIFKEGRISVTALRSPSGAARDITISAIGPDPNGTEQELATAIASFAIGADQAEILLDLPTELRNRVNRFEVQGTRSAGAVTLTDDALKRREVGLLSAHNDQEAQDLLSPLYYLNKALVPTADLIEGALQDMLLASPDVLVLADIATVSDAERDDLLDWIDEGGMLVRFAGPRTAAADIENNDPLMPVRLRAGGRSVGGAMSWGEPKALRAFTRDSPFFGLTIPDDVQVSSQVMAQPDPDLAERTIASLTDGTPLVTRKPLGDGQIILFHVTANAEWSTLPLSGLFVQMLERLAISTRPAEIAAEDLAGTTWVPEETLDAFGVVRDAGNLAGVAGEVIAEDPIGPDLPPGLYAGEDRRIALNVLPAEATLAPSAWSAGTKVEGIVVAQETPLMGALLSLALALLLVDIIASLALSGKLRGAATTALVLIAVSTLPQQSRAQDDTRALKATSEVVLAYVKTGDRGLDRLSNEGLKGLSVSLFRRTSVEPADPIAVDLETDELAFFPILYWPITESQPTPSADAYAKLNRYLRTGGMILFDTRDGNIGGFGTSTPQGRKLQALAAPLDIPALEPIPQDHVLTRTFYLLQDFPGRFTSRDIWVEAAPADAEVVDGLPFRDLNDGVTPVLIGGNDWAAAWARDASGNPRYPVGRGFAGERQRELAIRFGVNVVMHVLTGNYKSDQVHVPALLERLGN